MTWAHVIPGLYAANGTMQTAGGAYNWLKNTICRMETYDAKLHGKSPYDYMNEQIAQAPVGANGIIFLPYLLGERAPRWNVDAKGPFIGLKSSAAGRREASGVRSWRTSTTRESLSRRFWRRPALWERQSQAEWAPVSIRILMR